MMKRKQYLFLYTGIQYWRNRNNYNRYYGRFHNKIRVYYQRPYVKIWSLLESSSFYRTLPIFPTRFVTLQYKRFVFTLKIPCEWGCMIGCDEEIINGKRHEAKTRRQSEINRCKDLGFSVADIHIWGFLRMYRVEDYRRLVQNQSKCCF